MRKDLKPAAILFPEPAIVIGTYDEDGTPNAMLAAWSAMSDFKQIFIALDMTHKTADNIKNRKAFTVSVLDEAHYKQGDYLGMVTGRKVADKVERAGLHPVKSTHVDAPYFEEFPLTFECSLAELDTEHERVFGDIVNINAEESILDEKGKVDITKLQPVSFDPVANTYVRVSGLVGHAFKDGSAYLKK
jgi:flavin reductase (DIM6/NTAB) family NADH-FMN oxidoreductase RutF